MKEEKIFEPPVEFRQKARLRSLEDYKKMYERSMRDPEGFWSEMAEDLAWFRKWDKVFEADFNEPRVSWFIGGKLNASYNCLDRHLNSFRKNKAALIYEGERGREQILTYQHLHYLVCKFANVLKKKGIKKGDRIAIYLPMMPELPISMLAASRIGAIHTVIFAGFSAEFLRDRINDEQAKLLITADGSFRGEKVIELKKNADAALAECPEVESCIVCKRTGTTIDMIPGRDSLWDDEMTAPDISPVCKPEIMDAEDPLFILYTSGSTGKPKGVLHTTGGYLLYAIETLKWIFDIREEDTFWCTADIGWITGHSYIVYGPLAAGATSVLFEGTPTYPAPDRLWEVVEKHRVSIFYTAPTLIRALVREGESWPEKHDLSSLRLLGSVGEVINPEAWLWYHRVIGQGRCPIVDTWWQTETGGVLISPFPGATPLKPGSAVLPFFGVDAAVIDADGQECPTNKDGFLVIKKTWPGMMHTVYGHPERFKETYFSQFPGLYFTGDGARRDKDGYFWITGRIDDVINVSGHRLGTAEIESALVSYPDVAEAAVVGYPHEIKGQAIYAFVILKKGITRRENLQSELIKHVRKKIGPIAAPEKIQFVDALPKTRSGKIMRRILKNIAQGKFDQLGDTSTLADPSVIEELIKNQAR
ncbi:MAG: acetate--CoA ligase [Deltaproteobacteria bacterium]|nr:MAG: acetate--CoA ligase [Deltaproteobacteria bacterium]